MPYAPPAPLSPSPTWPSPDVLLASASTVAHVLGAAAFLLLAWAAWRLWRAAALGAPPGTGAGGRPEGDCRAVSDTPTRCDTAGREEAEGKLASANALLESILDSTADGILVVDAGGRIERFNRAFLSIWAIPDEVARSDGGRHVLPAIFSCLKNPGDVVVDAREIADDDAAESFSIVELKDGRSVEKYAQPHRMNDRVVGRVWSFRDVTDRLRAEKGRRDVELRLQSLFESSPMGIYTYRLDGGDRLVMTGANPATDLHTGFDNQSRVGLTIEEAFPPLVGTEVPTRYRDAARDGISWQTTQLSYKEGSLSGAFDIFAFQTSPGEMAVMFTEVTAVKRAEAERDRLLSELSQKNKELENVVYVASHDLRSPLVNILGFAQRLDKSSSQLADILGRNDAAQSWCQEMGPIVRERIPAALRYVQSSANKMDSLINGLLKLSRTGRAALQPVDLDVGQLAREAVSAMKFQIEKAQAEVYVDDLPACRGDSAQINQVVSNLLDNALKYRAEGRPLRVRVSGRVSEGESLYCVEDNGVGIMPDHLGRIWEIFHRLNPRGETQGEGLGLTLVRRIVERHGGRAWAESAPGEGSRFFFALQAGAN